MSATYWFICVREAYAPVLSVSVADQGTFNRAVVNAVQGLRNSRHGIGDLLLRPNAKAIPNHLLCDGSEVSRTSYPQLFDEIGIDWGAGDGSTTFNLPNLNTTALPVPATVPDQTVTDSSSSTGTTAPTDPSDPGETGGTRGGQPGTGGRPGRGAIP